MLVKNVSMLWTTRLVIYCSNPKQGVLNDKASELFLSLHSQGWEFFAVDQSRGRCYYKTKTITIPVWAMQKSTEYLEWYVCHEISHVIAGHKASHGTTFQKVLASLCSQRAIRFELTYKAREVVRAGIQLTCLLDD